jgi:hypothetical protein
MALKPWHRAGLTAAGMALAMAVALPPRPLPEPGEVGSILFPAEWPMRPAAQHAYTLSGTLANLRVYMRAARMADSLFSLAAGPRALHSADRALTVIYTPPVSAESARVWLGMMERELALVPRGVGGGMPLIVRLRAARQTKLPMSWSARDWRSMRFVSPRPERPACFVDLPLEDRGTRTAERSGMIHRDERTGVARTRVLNSCLLYARFGAPGPQVERWAGRRAERQYWPSGPQFEWLLDMQRRGRLHEELAYFWGPGRLAGACSADAGPCLRMVGLIRDPAAGWEDYFALRRNSLLAGLILEDPARFERFWRSPEPPAIALERAYGRPAGQIVADWQRAIATPEAGGPRVPADALLSSLGWAILAIGLGLLVAWRQQVRP